MNIPLLLPLILLGFSFTIIQVIVIREMLVIFAGNELSIAIIIANWLLLEAIGSYFLGKKIKELGLKEGSYAYGQFLVAFLLPATIYGIRCIRQWIGLTPGEGASIVQIFLWTIPVLAPLGIVGGTLFALGCHLYSTWIKKGAGAIGKVYFLEALGAGAGGMIYTFWMIPFFSSLQVAFILGAMNLFSGLLLLWASVRREVYPTRKILWGLGCASIVYLLFLIFSVPQILEESSIHQQWKGIKVVESRWSPFGNVTVGQREGQLTFFANGIPVCNTPFPDIALTEEKVHYPLLSSSSPDKFLIIGGGFGGVISEVLKHPVREVHYAEMDPLMVDLIRKNPTSLTRQEMEDPRVRIHVLDGRLFVKNTREKFAGVILNLPIPSTLGMNRFYTIEFFNEVGRILEKGGVLAFSLPGSETYLSREKRNLNACLIQSLNEVFPAVQVIPGETHLILASVSADRVPLSSEKLLRHLHERKISTFFLTDFQIRLKLEKQRQQWLEQSLARGEKVRLNRDANPSALYYSIAYWNSEFHPFLQFFWKQLGGLRPWHFSLPWGILICVIFVFRPQAKKGWREGVLCGVVGTTGFFGTAIMVLLIFSFQTFLGYAYHWVGLMIAIFMAGLALGSGSMPWIVRRKRSFSSLLIRAELAIIFCALAGLIFLAVFYFTEWGTRNFTLTRWGFLVLNGTGGFLVGLEFSLSNYLFSGGRVARTAGILYAADLFGAWAGSLWVGVLLIPVLGIPHTWVVMIFLKMLSLSLILGVDFELNTSRANGRACASFGGKGYPR